MDSRTRAMMLAIAMGYDPHSAGEHYAAPTKPRPKRQRDPVGELRRRRREERLAKMEARRGTD